MKLLVRTCWFIGLKKTANAAISLANCLAGTSDPSTCGVVAELSAAQPCPAAKILSYLTTFFLKLNESIMLFLMMSFAGVET